MSRRNRYSLTSREIIFDYLSITRRGGYGCIVVPPHDRECCVRELREESAYSYESIITDHSLVEEDDEHPKRVSRGIPLEKEFEEPTQVRSTILWGTYVV